MVDDKNWNVVETLAGLNMYEQSPNGEETAASLLHFKNRFHLCPANLVCFMMDGYSVNTNAVNRLCETFESINVKRVRYLSHFLSLVGNKLECDEFKKKS